MCAHWRHLANTTEHVLPSAHRNPQPKWQIDRFSQFCTAHGRVSSGISFPLLIALSHAGSGPHLMHASLVPPESITQTASRSVQPFLHSLYQSVVGHVGHALLLKIAPSQGGSVPRLIRASLGPLGSASQTASWSVQPFYAVYRRVSLCFTMGRLFPPPNVPSHRRSEPGSLVHPSPQPKQHLDWFSHFCRAH